MNDNNDNINTHTNYPDSDLKLEIPALNVTPLKKICMTIGELPSSYLETMTYYEMLVWFIHFLQNTIIPTVNNNSEALQEVQTVVLELQEYINDYKDSIDSDVEDLENYINNYFDNLDVQEEINNKLDAMADSGQLTEIIAQYLGLAGMNVFTSVSDMKNASNLVEGSKCETLGYYEANDGGGSIYIVVNDNTLVDDGGSVHDLQNNLKAQIIYTDNMVPEQFGAKGDNDNDDTNAINNLLSKVSTIHLNPKTYLIEEAITLNNNNKIIGSKDSIIHKTGNNSVITASNKTNILLKDFTITGEIDTSENQNGISFYTCSNSKIDNITINGVSNDGVYLNTCNNIKVSNMNILNTKHAGYLCYQGDKCLFENSLINGENSEFKYNCQFKSCINSTMDNITILNGTEISCYISQEDVEDNPDTIRPIFNTINNIKCYNHGITWTPPSTGYFDAIVIDGDYSSFSNLFVYQSYTGGIYSVNPCNSSINNLIVNDFAKSGGNYVGIYLRGSYNNISNITTKKGNNYIGLRTAGLYNNYNNINTEDCGSSTNPQIQVADTESYFNNVTLVANTMDVRGISFYFSSSESSNVTVNNLNAVKVNNTYTAYDISGSVPTSVNIYAIKPTKANIRGNMTKPFTYVNDRLIAYEIDSANSYANLTWLAGDVRVFSRTGVTAVGYEKTIYNGSSWVNVNSLT